MTQENTYSKGHPWYYVLGGKIPTLKEIKQDAENSKYNGYREEEIQKCSHNNSKLRLLREQVRESLKKDISRYRQVALELHRYRKTTTEICDPICKDIHTSMSLKYNHIFNEFANLKYIRQSLSYQPDLFD